MATATTKISASKTTLAKEAPKGSGVKELADHLGTDARTLRTFLRRTERSVGRGTRYMQEWLGHADPGFTLRTYVHLMDEGLGDADFLDVAVQPSSPSSGSSRADAIKSAAFSE